MAIIDLKFFGRLSELAPADGAVDHSDANSVADLLDILGTHDDALGEALRAISTKVMVNQVIVHKDTPLNDGDEVAFLPPVSGG